MGWLSDLLSFGSSAASSGVSSGAGNLLSDVVVNGVSNAGSKALSSAASSALSGAAGSALGKALSGTSSSKAPSSTGSDPTDVSEVVVPGDSAAAAPQMLNLSPALLGALGTSDLTSSRLANLNSASQAFANSPDEPTDVSGITVTPTSPASINSEAAAASPGQVPGLESVPDMTALMDMDASHFPGAEGDPAHKSLMDKLGLDTKSLLALGLLGMGTFAGQNKKGVADTQEGQDLAAAAATNKDLISRLSQSADAGREGIIGGQGLNAIRRSVRNAQAAIRQRYSSMGMSGSTAETADLNAAVQAGTDAQFKVGQDLATSGLQAVAQLSGVNANIYSTLLKAQTAQDTDLGNALANFVGATAGHLLGTTPVAKAA